LNLSFFTMPQTKKSDEKSRKILAAVRSILARKGYVGTTINLVAAEAGVSRGLLHYYFKNKEEMLATVIRDNMQLAVELVTDLLENSSSAADFATRLVAALRHVLRNDPDFFHLFFEGWAVARQSRLVRRTLEELYGKFRLAMSDGLQKAQKNGTITPRLPISSVATLLTGLVDGLGLQMMTEPDLAADADTWQDIARGITGLLESGGSAAD
jgi:AcrR family transcriptional regulator